MFAQTVASADPRSLEDEPEIALYPIITMPEEPERRGGIFGLLLKELDFQAQDTGQKHVVVDSL